MSIFKGKEKEKELEKRIRELEEENAKLKENLKLQEEENNVFAMEFSMTISECFETLRKIASGDPAARVIPQKGISEILTRLEQMVNKVGAGSEEMVNQIHELALGLCENFEVLRMVAEGDLTVSANERSSNELLSQLGVVTNKAIMNLSALTKQTKESTLQISSAVNQILSATEEQASCASEQAASVTESTTGIEELSRVARHIESNANMVVKSAEQSLDGTKISQKAMQDTLQAMEEIKLSTQATAKRILALEEKARSINEVVEIIKEIADQTNLLSLNASIEAARAGEAGKGFAVVAGEIRKLAENVVDSAKEIKDIITEIQSFTQASVMSIDEETKKVEKGAGLLTIAGKSSAEVVKMVENTTSFVQQINSSVQEQVSALELMVSNMKEVEKTTKESVTSCKQISLSAGDLTSLAEGLKGTVLKFKLK
jgi:methyl-accepting chemotaxis protein